MKNLIFGIIIIACVGLIIFGLTRKDEAKPDKNQTSAVAEKTMPAGTQAKTAATSAPAAIGQNVQHYRPETATPVSDSAADAERSFQITPDLLAKMYLVDTYKPGACYGAPVAVPQVAVTNLINSNQLLAAFLKQKYGLATDLEIYNKIKQLQGITLTETSSNKFNFTFMDGQCQTVTYYEGTVTVSGSSVSAIVSSQASHTYE